MEAYKSIYKDVITWLELPISTQDSNGNKSTAHIDGFIIDFENKRIIFIEAKRFSRENRVDSLIDDVKRIKTILDDAHSKDKDHKIRDLNIDEFEVRALFLADVWRKNKLYNNWKSNMEKLLDGGMEFVVDSDLDGNPDIIEINEEYALLYALMSY
jgi:hypothetical protein